MDLRKLTERAHETAFNNGFWDHPSDNDDLVVKLALVHTEISEAVEELRDAPKTGRGLADIDFEDSGKPVGFGIELADAVIRIADLAGHVGVDLDKMVRLKMDYNDTRPYRHGKAL